MASIGKAIGVVQIVGAILFVAILAAAFINTAVTDEPPRPDQETWVCTDGDIQPPSLDREGCLNHGGLDHAEDGRS